MGDWQHSFIDCAWRKSFSDRRVYWVVFCIPFGWLGNEVQTSYKAVVDDFGTLVKV